MFADFAEKREWGLRRAIAWYIYRALRRILNVHIYRLWMSSGNNDAWIAGLPSEVPEGYTARLVEPEELIPYAKPENDLDVEFLEESQARKDECVACFYDGEVVSYGFNATTRSPVTAALDIQVPPGFVYGFKVWTHPDHRRRGLTKVRGKVMHDYRTQHRIRDPRIIRYIEFNNYASMLNNRYEPPNERSLYLGIIGWIGIGGKVIPFNGRRARWIGAVLVKKGAPFTRTHPYT